jgi:hypothetical protein
MPIVGEPQAHTFYPVHLLSLVAPPALAFKLSFLLHILLGSWLMYRLVRELGASRFGGAVAALVFGLHGQMIGFVYAGWIHQVMPMAWAPGVVWMFCRALRSPHRWPGGAIAGTGAFLGIQIISGHPEWVRYTLFILGVLTISGLPNRATGLPAEAANGVSDSRRRDDERQRGPTFVQRLTLCAATVVLGLLISGVQLLPLVQAARHSSRAQEAVAAGVVREGAGRPPLTLPTVVAPRPFGPWDQNVSADGLVHKLSGSLVSCSESLVTSACFRCSSASWHGAGAAKPVQPSGRRSRSPACCSP